MSSLLSLSTTYLPTLCSFFHFPSAALPKLFSLMNFIQSSLHSEGLPVWIKVSIFILSLLSLSLSFFFFKAPLCVWELWWLTPWTTETLRTKDSTRESTWDTLLSKSKLLRESTPSALNLALSVDSNSFENAPFSATSSLDRSKSGSRIAGQ